MKLSYTIALFLLLSCTALAQEKEKSDTTKVKVKPDFRPTGVRFGTDAIALVKSQYDKTFKGWEFNGDIDFHRYYLAVDYGHWARTYLSDGDSSNYANTGNYFRAGVDVNFLKNDPDRNMFFIGFRYGVSKFSEQYSVIVVDTLWGPGPGHTYSGTYNNTDVSAHWLELTTGLRVKIWKMIWMGYTARFKFGLSTGSTPAMLPHDVPGYGLAEKDSYWGFNYQIFIRIPFRKLPTVSPEK